MVEFWTENVSVDTGVAAPSESVRKVPVTLALRFENVELLPEVQLPHDPRQTTTSTVHGLRYRVPAMADVRLVVGAREVRSLTVPLPQFGRVAELAPDEALDAKGRWLYRIDPADGSLHAVSVDGL